jgi:hypothetical protein
MELITLLLRTHRPNTFYGMDDQTNGQNWLHGVEVRLEIPDRVRDMPGGIIQSGVCTRRGCD